MKKIYIILTDTGTILSKAIKVVKKSKYTHVSISLDKELKQMYSFGRIYPYVAFIGGFVKESPEYGTFKRFSNTEAKIFYLEVTDEQYKKIKRTIKYFKRHRKQYKFNIMGLVLAAMNKKISKENEFYCSEFVKFILEEAKIKNNLPTIATPEDFLSLANTFPIYTGYLKNY